MSAIALYSILGVAALLLLFLGARGVLSMLPVLRAPAMADGPAAAAGSSATETTAPPCRLARARCGTMLVNPNDRYIGRAILEYGEYCEHEAQFLQSLLPIRAGAVIEIGANIGCHTVPLAQALAREKRELIAFEPQPFVFQNLCANLALNGIGNVRAWPYACGAQGGMLYFSAPDYESDGNFGTVSMVEHAVPGGISVPAVRLDDFLGDAAVALIKIDVEGFELSALQGAQETLSRWRPVLYLENDQVEKSQALIEWLWSKNYRLWWHISPLFNPDNFFGVKEDIFPALASFNMLGLPRELDVPVLNLQEIVSATAHPLAGK